ncbi:hypothetical protein J5N97_006581 [Dioscorea zingiberensis]|uniref:RING-type domain-containing protein n=1 Tax=Dioscorea zingiberensis TaxID=325984 RepID=A0A9D5DCE8_9LILI|nr:hypothetical protein J5N97_006581 [Dioscorea zingiberensis]
MRNMLLGIATQIMVMVIVISIVLLFIGLGVLVLIHACIVGRAFRRGLSTMTRGESCEGTGKGLSLDDLQQLPCYEFQGGGSVVGPVDCAVCLESFQLGEKCRLLPVCKHSFHVQCLDSWLMRTPICPICRTSADHRKIGSVSGVGIVLGLSSETPRQLSSGFR